MSQPNSVYPPTGYANHVESEVADASAPVVNPEPGGEVPADTPTGAPDVAAEVSPA